MAQSTANAGLANEDPVVRKVAKRLVWFLFLGAVCMSMDRTNIGFAALTMNKALHLSSAEYGGTVTIFNLGYILAAIPSNIGFARFGAKVWLSRLMIIWGLAATALCLAIDKNSLYTLRFFLGMAEGGFLPGIVLYMSYWLPESKRTQAVSIILLGQPLMHFLGPVLSGPLLDMDGTLGIAGWRWLFFVQGLPTVLLGIAAYFYLADNPLKARWLTPEQKTALQNTIAREEKAPRPKGETGFVFRELCSLKMVLLSFAYLGIPISLATYVTWSSLIVRGLLPTDLPFTYIGFMAGLPAIGTVFFQPLWSGHSDRTHERTYHIVLSVLGAVAGWLMVIYLPSPVAQMFGLGFAVTGTYAAQGIIFPFGASLLAPSARPVGIAIMSTVGVAGAAFSPWLTGHFKDLTGEYTIGIQFVVVMLIVAVICTFAVSALARRQLRAQTA